MNGVDAVGTALQSTQHLVTWFLSDLSDADMLVRAAPGANHIAWQMGHLIVAEGGLVRPQGLDVAYPEMPASFEKQPGKETQAADPPAGFATRAEYVDLVTKRRRGTIEAVNQLSDPGLDRPTVGTTAKFAPMLGALLLLVSNHSLMHGGQFSVVRRKLGKPVLF